jgi:hypothetical protein
LQVKKIDNDANPDSLNGQKAYKKEDETMAGSAPRLRK